MNKIIDEAVARNIMGQNFIGSAELNSIKQKIFCLDGNVPSIPFTEEVIKAKRDDYILILGVSKFADGTPVTIRNMRSLFGKDPEINEPCFYNQDWYDNEPFVDSTMNDGWYFIRRKVYENSRAVQPQELEQKYVFPSAISCVYAFFATWLILDMKLWYHDFIWCSDKDHNGDRVYVGKYNDVDGINKNGFSIHRHLALRSCYACID